jgi:hypothetical protein
VCGTNPCASADNEQSSLSLRGQRK